MQPDTTALKVPPHSIEAEQSVLGALMLNNDAWFDVADIVAPSDFYRPQHRIVFEAMAALSRDSQPLDAVTVSEALQSRGLLDKAGGIAYLAELVDGTPGTSNVSAYARIVRDRSTLRKVITAASRIAEKAFMREGQSDEELLDYAEQAIFEISEERSKNEGPQDINLLLDRTVGRVSQLSKSDGGITGLATGFADLDRLTAGLQKADLVIVAGRPSMGKTSLAMNMVEHAIMQSDAPSLVFSLEMPADQLVMRMLSSLARIDQSRMRVGDLENKDWDRFTAAVNQLRDKPLHIDDSAALTPNEIRARARRVARQHKNLGLIVVDYLQLMRGSGQPENRTNEISEISRSLKALAKEMGCPVIAASQLNRALETRTNKRPIMADLRESGAIEQDADVILFIYRDEVYDKETEDKGTAEIIIGKQRNGPIGTVKLSYLGQLTRFEDLARDQYRDLSPEYGA